MLPNGEVHIAAFTIQNASTSALHLRVISVVFVLLGLLAGLAVRLHSLNETGLCHSYKTLEDAIMP